MGAKSLSGPENIATAKQRGARGLQPSLKVAIAEKIFKFVALCLIHNYLAMLCGFTNGYGPPGTDMAVLTAGAAVKYTTRS